MFRWSISDFGCGEKTNEGCVFQIDIDICFSFSFSFSFCGVPEHIEWVVVVGPGHAFVQQFSARV